MQENKILIYIHQKSDRIDFFYGEFMTFIKHPISMI